MPYFRMHICTFQRYHDSLLFQNNLSEVSRNYPIIPIVFLQKDAVVHSIVPPPNYHIPAPR